MSRTDTPWNLPDKTVDRADEADREIRMSDFTLLAILPLRTVETGPYPLNELATAALVGLCLMRPSRGGSRLPQPVLFMCVALFALLLGSGFANHLDWTRRMGHVAILLGLVWAFGTGRVSLRSAGLGLSLSLGVVSALAMFKIGGDYYPGRLTGFLGDPNAAAYFLAAMGIPAIFFADRRASVRVALAIPVLGGLLLTYSRTGFLALTFAAVWMLFGRKLGQVAGTVLAIGMVWVVNNIPESLTTFGPFSDRTGSDNLRDRIIAQERVEIASAPWYGNGPGSAKVSIRDLEFFFHNSYLATRQEGGWCALILVLALLAFSFVRLADQARAGDIVAAAAQAGIIGVAVMAVTLGEVLLDTPMAIVAGFALGQALRAPPEEADG